MCKWLAWWVMMIILVVIPPSKQWPMFNIWRTSLGEQSAKWNGHKISAQPRALNFFPIPVEEECRSEDQRRRGICMNTYECRMKNGQSHGPCALGFGVCCVITKSCDATVDSNLTYITSPGFPNLIESPLNCSITVKKIESQISQLRIDFVHFSIGQPHRRTGICDEDVMEITSGDTRFQLCGWNSGQHMYIDVEDGPIKFDFILPSNLQSRMWEMSIIQLPFEQRAPDGCLQYFDSPQGTLKTLNFLPNGRYLANQDYSLCIRQERGMCSIAYTPCNNNTFRIGTPLSNTIQNDETNDTEGSGTSVNDQLGLMRRCDDRVLIPCDVEEFLMPGSDAPGICDLEHCGNSLCGPSELDVDGNCRVETSYTPFHIRVEFGMGNENATTLIEDMVGMCLNYEQLPCVA